MTSLATAGALRSSGTEGHLIDVQVDISPARPGPILVGRPDKALQEARDRVRMAITNAVPPWPATRRVTILLTPADLPKSGTHFDLAIAVAVKAADQSRPREGAPDHRIAQAALEGTAFIGELTLSGNLRPVAGVLPMVLAARARGIRRVFVPEPQAREAMMVPDMTVFGVRSLAQVVAELRGEDVPEAPPVEGTTSGELVDLARAGPARGGRHVRGGGHAGRHLCRDRGRSGRPPHHAQRPARCRARPRWPSGSRRSCPT